MLAIPAPYGILHSIVNKETAMQYIILQDTRSEVLAWEVNAKIAEGYKPLGGVSVAGTGTWLIFSQAMVKGE